MPGASTARDDGRGGPMKIDVFPHILPRKYFERLLAVAPPGLALQKRMSGIPVLVDLDLRFTMMDRWEGYVQVLTLACCWSIRMSPLNCSVRMSPHGDMGDIHDEPKGSAPGRVAQGGAGREHQQCSRRPRPSP